MYKVTRVIHFCYGHRLLNYDGKCRNLHGHNGRVEIELFSETLNPFGMVRDFGDIKKIVQTWIDSELDHKMILCRRDPLLPSLNQFQEPVFLVDENPTAEVICKLIYDYALSQQLPISMVRLWETKNSFASYGSE
jgi:6-pyruvoyltetrahydropterin/6-carboxytetrahydropterin synthase